VRATRGYATPATRGTSPGPPAAAALACFFKEPNSVICLLRKPQNILHLDAIAQREN